MIVRGVEFLFRVIPLCSHTKSPIDAGNKQEIYQRTSTGPKTVHEGKDSPKQVLSSGSFLRKS